MYRAAPDRKGPHKDGLDLDRDGAQKVLRKHWNYSFPMKKAMAQGKRKMGTLSTQRNTKRKATKQKGKIRGGRETKWKDVNPNHLKFLKEKIPFDFFYTSSYTIDCYAYPFFLFLLLLIYLSFI